MGREIGALAQREPDDGGARGAQENEDSEPARRAEPEEQVDHRVETADRVADDDRQADDTLHDRGHLGAEVRGFT